MPTSAYIQQLEAVPAAVLDKDFEFVKSIFAVPLGLYFQNTLLHCETPDELLGVATGLGDAFRSAGLVTVSVKTLASNQGRNGDRHSILLHQSYRDAQGHEIDVGLARYFYMIYDDAPRIELFECLRMPVPDAVARAPMFDAA